MIVVVADTSPLNYLIQIHCDHVLPALYERVLVPSVVVQELSHPNAVEASCPHVVDAKACLARRPACRRSSRRTIRAARCRRASSHSTGQAKRCRPAPDGRESRCADCPRTRTCGHRHVGRSSPGREAKRDRCRARTEGSRGNGFSLQSSSDGRGEAPRKGVNLTELAARKRTASVLLSCT